jgi:hypothetical protein
LAGIKPFFCPQLDRLVVGYFEIAYDSGMEPETTTITLDPTEAQFLVTVLKSSAAILTAVMALQQSFPGLSPPPIGTDAIANITILAGKIAAQVNSIQSS